MFRKIRFTNDEIWIYWDYFISVVLIMLISDFPLHWNTHLLAFSDFLNIISFFSPLSLLKENNTLGYQLLATIYSIWLRYWCCADHWAMWRSNTSILGFWAAVQYSYTNYLTFFVSLPMLCLTVGRINSKCLLCKMRKELKIPQKDIYSKIYIFFNIMQLI